MHNDLVLGIDAGLAIISLDRAVGSHHGGRVIVRNITLFFSTRGTQLGLVLGQPGLDKFCLFLQPFHLLLPAGARSPGPGRIIRPPVGLYLLCQQLRYFGLDFLLFLLELGKSAAPLFRGIGRQLAAIQGKHRAAQQVHLLTDRQHVSKKRENLIFQGRNKGGNGAVIGLLASG